jgi:hypothetical protein
MVDAGRSSGSAYLNHDSGNNWITDADVEILCNEQCHFT